MKHRVDQEKLEEILKAWKPTEAKTDRTDGD